MRQRRTGMPSRWKTSGLSGSRRARRRFQDRPSLADGIRLVPPPRLVRDTVRRIRRHQGRGHPCQDAVHIVGRRRIAAEQTVRAQGDQISAREGGGPRRDDRVLVGEARDGLGEQRGQLLVGPKRGELNTGGMEFLKRRLIPHEVELADAIVGER